MHVNVKSVTDCVDCRGCDGCRLISGTYLPPCRSSLSEVLALALSSSQAVTQALIVSMRYRQPHSFFRITLAILAMLVGSWADVACTQEPLVEPESPPLRYNPHASASALRAAKGQVDDKRPAFSQSQQQIAEAWQASRQNFQLGRPANVPEIPTEVRQMLPPGCLETWSGQTPPQGRMVSSQVDLNFLGGELDRLGPPRQNNAGPGDSLLDMGPNQDPLSGLGPGGMGPGGIDPLGNLGPTDPGATRGAPAATHGGAAQQNQPEDPHRAIFLQDRYPSALTCAKCHPKHFDEWRVSAHAYSSVSPMFQRFEQTLTDLSQGTVGVFCMRCHAPVATQEAIPRYASLLDAPAVVREGITCVACHRVVESYGKTHGHRRVELGSIHDPIVGAGTGEGLAEAIADREKLKLKIDPSNKGPGQDIHNGMIRFETLSRSDFCLTCHQVAVHPGIWLEVVYSQYNAGPAKAKGITCQDCHMGAIPGKPNGYEEDYCAHVGDKPYGIPRKHSSHMFWGPGYSIAHPGLFPIDEKAERWSPREWLRFDWQQGWGTEEFERAISAVEAMQHFPPPWNEPDERRDARKVLDSNLAALARARAGSIAAMEAGSEITGPFMNDQPRAHAPLKFHYVVTNVSEGHNLPTGSLGAQPQVWLNVALVGPNGRTVWESGYLDTQGDLADMHSEDVAKGLVPRDSQLFNLQTKFLITNIKGTDREVALPVNVDIDQIPFLRPGAVPVSVLNHPPFIRMEAHSIPPLDSRKARYVIPADRICSPGVYRLDVRLRSRVEPSYFMRFVGSTPEMINRMNHQILDVHTQSFQFLVR